jgi:S1-C subfamily serine protease
MMIRELSKQSVHHPEAVLQLVISALLLVIAAMPVWGAQQAGGVPASGPRVKMVRSVAGTKGEPRGGSFVMADPRTTFFVPDDHQVIVYFEWEAPRGKHHCEGTLHGPSGQLAVMSSFDYAATELRFAGYWTIPLLPNTSAGVWTFESHVDGESAGTLNFEIASGTRPTVAVKEEVPSLTPAQLYAQAEAATVLIEKLDEQGRRFDTASGFFLDDGLLVTAFRAIDGARALRIRLPDGGTVQSDAVVAWNRRRDWALLNIDAGKSSKLSRKAESKLEDIGDLCYWLDTKPDGSRVIADGQIVGKQAREGAGERLSISGIFNSMAIGGPVLDEHGNVVGLLGGAPPEPRKFTAGSTFTTTGSVVPIELVTHSTNSSFTSFQTLWNTNQFTAPVTQEVNISFGMITQGKPQKGKVPFPKQMQTDFSGHDEFASVVIAFQGIQPWKSDVQLQIYDADNELISRAVSIKVNLRSGETQERTWSFSLPKHPGLYRADVLVGANVAWREYFRVSE